MKTNELEEYKKLLNAELNLWAELMEANGPRVKVDGKVGDERVPQILTELRSIDAELASVEGRERLARLEEAVKNPLAEAVAHYRQGCDQFGPAPTPEQLAQVSGEPAEKWSQRLYQNESFLVLLSADIERSLGAEPERAEVLRERLKRVEGLLAKVRPSADELARLQSDYKAATNQLAVANRTVKRLRHGKPKDEVLKEVAERTRKKNGKLNYAAIARELEDCTAPTVKTWCILARIPEQFEN